MKKSILNIGKVLNKAEQKEVKGGYMAYDGVGAGGLCHTTRPDQCDSGKCNRGSGRWGLCA